MTSPNWKISGINIGTPIQVSGCRFYSSINRKFDAVWLRDGKEVAQVAFEYLGSDIYLANDYEIPSARLEDEGLYQCALKVNENRVVWSIPKELKLQGKENYNMTSYNCTISPA